MRLSSASGIRVLLKSYWRGKSTHVTRTVWRGGIPDWRNALKACLDTLFDRSSSLGYSLRGFGRWVLTLSRDQCLILE